MSRRWIDRFFGLRDQNASRSGHETDISQEEEELLSESESEIDQSEDESTSESPASGGQVNQKVEAITLDELWMRIGTDPSLRSSVIVSSSCYAQRSAPFYVKHRFLVLDVRQDSFEPPLWLRMDRRRSSEIGSLKFILNLGITPANDTAVLSSVQKSLLLPSAHHENQQFFQPPYPMTTLAPLLLRVIHVMRKYRLTSENCWAFCSLLQENFSFHQIAWFTMGKLTHTKLARRARLNILATPALELYKFPSPNVPADGEPATSPSERLALRTSQSAFRDLTASLTRAEGNLKAASTLGFDALPRSLIGIIEAYERLEDSAEDGLEDLEMIRSGIQDFIDAIIEPMQMSEAYPYEFVTGVMRLCEDLDIRSGQLLSLSGAQHTSEDLERQRKEVQNAIDDAFSEFFGSCGDQIGLAANNADDASEALHKLRVADAGYIRSSKDFCLPTTRSEVRDAIHRHLSNQNERFMWLRGSIGTGKTAIAGTIAEELDDEGRLAASFFFEPEKVRPKSHAQSVERFVQTLARQLADFDLRYRMALLRVLTSRAWTLPSSPTEQLETLILGPFSQVSDEGKPASQTAVIVIDGLSDSGDDRALVTLMTVIAGLSRLPPTFHVLVSSLPEFHITRVFQERWPNASILDLDASNTQTTLDDISTYLRTNILDIPREGLQQWPPSDGQITDLARLCQGIFEIAAICMRILRESDNVPPDAAFQELLDNPERSISTFSRVFLQILRRAYISPYLSTSEALVSARQYEVMKRPERDQALARYRVVVGAILCLKWPLDLVALSKLLGLPSSDVLSTLSPISSLINVSEDSSDLIYFSQPLSRQFFVQTPFGSSEERAFFFDNSGRSALLLPCLNILNTTFAAIASSTTSRAAHQTLDIERDFERISHHDLSLELLYSASAWFHHLDPGQFDGMTTHIGTLHMFLAMHWTRWIETIIYVTVFDLWPFAVTAEPRERTLLIDASHCLSQTSQILSAEHSWIGELASATTSFLAGDTLTWPLIDPDQPSFVPFLPIVQILAEIHIEVFSQASSMH